MTTKNAVGAVAVAALLVLAGCSTAVPGTTTQVQATTDDGVGDDTGSMDASDSAALTFYVSDRPGAIEDFEHLNVTITKIGLHEAGGDDATDDDENETESANDTTEADANADVGDVDTTTVDDPNETTVEMNDTETESEDSAETEEPEETEETEDEESEDEESEEAESEDDDSEDSEKDGWVMHDVDNETVDLTKLKGANATAISNVSVPAGEYDKVFVYVSDINATLTNGESVNVKLPSSKLQINKNFELSANSSPDFVFDINVHKAGNSGKYILRPVVGESGTGDQVAIEKVNKNGKPENPGNSGAKGKDKGDDDDDDEDDGDDRNEDDASETERALDATLDGKVRAGKTVTLSVTDANGSVANATVSVNGETIGETDTDGTLAFEVPDTDELEVTVTSGDAEVELERKVKGGAGGGNGNGNGQVLSGHALAVH